MLKLALHPEIQVLTGFARADLALSSKQLSLDAAQPFSFLSPSLQHRLANTEATAKYPRTGPKGSLH